MNSSGWGWGATSATTNALTVWPTVTGGGVTIYPQLPSVVDSRYDRSFAHDRRMTAREWLDAQVEDVCALAAI